MLEISRFRSGCEIDPNDLAMLERSLARLFFRLGGEKNIGFHQAKKWSWKTLTDGTFVHFFTAEIWD